VGLYPAGASRARIHDLAGTVFEWCSSVHQDGSTGDVSDNRPRVLRGGSWDFVQDDARCADRNANPPFVRNSNFGFRVVCSSPIVTSAP
jgi:formylglycine-generating enzyme required for sulfatase activity